MRNPSSNAIDSIANSKRLVALGYRSGGQGHRVAGRPDRTRATSGFLPCAAIGALTAIVAQPACALIAASATPDIVALAPGQVRAAPVIAPGDAVSSVFKSALLCHFALLLGFLCLMRRTWPLSWKASTRTAAKLIMAAAALALMPQMASAQVIWEDYQGTTTVGPDDALPQPAYNNADLTSAIRIANLRAIAANPANSVRTGTSTTIDYNQASGTLCDTLISDVSPSCQLDVMGRVLYVRIKFPVAGSYTLSLSHDDEVDIDMSSDYTNTNYRNLSYDIPISNLASFTTGDTVFETVGNTITAPAANSCAIMRIYWNNYGQVNHLRLRWGGAVTTQIIPASALSNPTSAATGCTGTVTTTSTAITVNKLVGATGRVATADQFAVGLSSGATSIASATTSGSGTGQQASTGANIVVVGTTYTISDAMAAGSANTLAAYTPTIACTRNGAAFSPGGSAPSWTVSATAANQRIICNITNTKVPVVATVESGTGVSGVASTPIANVRTNDTINGALATSANSTIAVSGTWPTGITLNTTSGAVSITAAVAPGTYSIAYTLCQSSAPANCQTVTDTVTVSAESDVAITKTNTPGANGNVDQTADTVTSGSTTTYTLTVTNSGPSSVTGAVVTDAPGTGITCPAANVVTITGSGVPAGSFTVANLTGAGITLGTLASGQSATLTVTCNVN